MQRLYGRHVQVGSTTTFGDMVVQLATFATGDGTAALGLARVALHNAPNLGTAVRNLYRLLPESWLNWPSAGPRESLELGLRYSQTERLISVLGEWSPADRLILGLYLLVGIPRDEIERWVPYRGAEDRVMALLRHVARTIGWSEEPHRSDTCIALENMLLEADVGEYARTVRLHLLSCLACQSERAALQQAGITICHAISIMFHAPKFEGQTWSQPPLVRAQQMQRLRRVGLALLCFTLIGAWRHGAATTQPPAHVTAITTTDSVLERALHRWDHGPTYGVAHESARALSGDRTLFIERWYDWSPPHRLRLTIRDNHNLTLLDLVADGSGSLGYSVNIAPSSQRSNFVRNPEVAALIPILLAIPAVGPLGSFPADQRNIDLELLWTARQNDVHLLGSTVSRGRRADELIVTPQTGDKLRLLVDRETATLLEATRIVHDSSHTLLVWQTDVVETQAFAPAGTFSWPSPLSQLPSDLSPVPDPRQLASAASPGLPLPTILSRRMQVPFPGVLPSPHFVAFVHDVDGPSMPVQQDYEGVGWSAVVITSRLHFRDLPLVPVDRTAGNTQYTILPNSPPGVLHADWQIGSARGSLYLWVAGTDLDGQRTMLTRMLESLAVLTPENIGALEQHIRPATLP